MSRRSWIFVTRTLPYFFAAAVLLLVVNSALATSPPGVVDIFVTTSAYSYTDTYNVQSPLTPLIGASKTIYVNGHVTDGDGVGTGFTDGDLKSVDLRLYRENVVVSCTPDLNNCYQAACTVTSNSSTVLNYSCTVDLSYLVDSTMDGGGYPNEVWNAEIIVKDDINQIGSLIKQFEVQTMLAVDFPSTIDFGQFSPGEETTSLNNTEYILTQQGNDVASVLISGTDMICTVVGSIPIEKIAWSLIDVGASHASATSTTTTPTNTGLSIGTDDTGSLSKSVYLNLQTPVGAGGTCSGTLVVEAIAA